MLFDAKNATALAAKGPFYIRWKLVEANRNEWERLLVTAMGKNPETFSQNQDMSQMTNSCSVAPDFLLYQHYSANTNCIQTKSII